MSIKSLLSLLMNCIYSTETLMPHLQKAGRKSCHLLPQEPTVAEENLHKWIADFLEALSPSLKA